MLAQPGAARPGATSPVASKTSASQASVGLWDGFWEFDGPLPAGRKRVARLAVVCAVWVLCAVPVVTGWQRCPVALFLREPCPGCGMTRALRLLLRGHVARSLQMHPLAVPVLLAGIGIAGATVWATWALGTPVRVTQTRAGRAAIAAAIAVYTAALVLWGLRWFGWFGGPVPV
jgi:hypothetical protein